MSLGLDKRIVELTPHHPDWAAEFAAARDALLAGTTGFVAIEHVGSTAVPGLIAKPILDLAAGIEAMPVPAALLAELEALGWIDCGDKGADGGHLLVREAAPLHRTHHLHVVAHDGPIWHVYLRFRDALRADPAVRAQYAAVKRDLKARFPTDRPSYTAGKHDFIRGVLERA